MLDGGRTDSLRFNADESIRVSLESAKRSLRMLSTGDSGPYHGVAASLKVRPARMAAVTSSNATTRS